MNDYHTYVREMFGLLSINKKDSKKLFGLIQKHGLCKIDTVEGMYPTNDDGSHTRYHGLEITLKNGKKLRVVSSLPVPFGGYHLERILD